MKKVLFGIIALSMAAFAEGGSSEITTPGKNNPATLNETASVPVRVIAEVVKPANALVITDEAGTILDELLLDHKIVGGTNTSDSVIAKNFKVRVTGDDGAVNTSAVGSVRINLSSTSTTLTKVGTDQGVTSKDTITSVLRLVNGVDKVDSNEYIAPLSEGEHLGTITSTIAAGSVPTAAGAYDNKVTGGMPTLSVTYSASGTPATIRK